MYLLLYRKFSKNLLAESNTYLLFYVSMSQALGRRSVAWFWFKVSHEMVIEILAKTAVSQGSTEQEHLRPGSFLWLLAGLCNSCPTIGLG